jgi:hypothetical protein
MILKSLKKIEEEQADLTMKAAVFRAELDALKSIPTDIIAMQVRASSLVLSFFFLPKMILFTHSVHSLFVHSHHLCIYLRYFLLVNNSIL